MSGEPKGDPVRLKTYRLAPRKARLECVGDELLLRLPTYFGRRRWRVPMAEVHVTDLTAAQTVIMPTEDVYAEPVSVPYLYTTGPLTRPTIMLLFTTPQRVPPLRFLTAFAPNSSLPFGYRASRSEEGARLDGVLLRAKDPADAVARLVAAGAERVDDPVAWMRSHRRLVADPSEATAIRSSETRVGKLRGWAAALFPVSLLTGRWVTDHNGPIWLWPIFVAAAVATVVLWVTARLVSRRVPPPTRPPEGTATGEPPVGWRNRP